MLDSRAELASLVAILNIKELLRIRMTRTPFIPFLVPNAVPNFFLYSLVTTSRVNRALLEELFPAPIMNQPLSKAFPAPFRSSFSIAIGIELRYLFDFNTTFIPKSTNHRERSSRSDYSYGDCNERILF